MNYDLKANITTILTFVLMPIFASLGIDAVTGDAMISVASVVVFALLMYFNERYLSGIFTKDGYKVVKESKSCDCKTLNHEYDSPLE